MTLGNLFESSITVQATKMIHYYENIFEIPI